MSLSNRINFASSSDALEYPDFLDIQIKSFKDFFQLETKSDERSDEGLYKTFLEKFSDHHSIVFVTIDVKDLDFFKQRLKPNRGQKVE